MLPNNFQVRLYETVKAGYGQYSSRVRFNTEHHKIMHITLITCVLTAEQLSVLRSSQAAMVFIDYWSHDGSGVNDLRLMRSVPV